MTRKVMPKQTKASPITENSLADILQANMERQRAMLLSWVDELERTLGREPRTSQIRQFWRDRGEPGLDKYK